MQYAVLVYEAPEARDTRNSPQTNAAYAAYTQMLVDAGVMRGGEALCHPETATTVWVQRGHIEVEDGPYADTKEQLGGLFVIEAEDLDAAIRYAAQCPAALDGGRVEVRPTKVPPS